MRIAHVYGAGLLGRGFVGPLLQDQYLTYFFDTDIVRRMALDSRTYPVLWGGVRPCQWIGPVVAQCPTQVRLCRDPDLIVTCVGPRGFPELVEHLVKQGVSAPILTLENDRKAANMLISRGLLAYSGIASVSVPDPGDWIYQFHRGAVLGDHNGVLYAPMDFMVDHGLRSTRQVPIHAYVNHHHAWDRKVLIHLAPHALCAYLGISRRLGYIHEVMEAMTEEIEEAIQPLLSHLETTWDDQRTTRLWRKERMRFSDPHLADSVWRVGRNPRLKVSAGERLMLGLHIAGGPLWEEAIAVALHLAEQDATGLPAPDDVKDRISGYQFDLEIPTEFEDYFS